MLMSLDHGVLLFDHDEQALAASVAAYLCNDLKPDEALVVLTTTSRLERLTIEMRVRGVDVGRLSREGRFLFFHAREVRRQILVDGGIDGPTLSARVLAPVQQVAERYRLRVYGEIAGTLWNDQEFAAARALEHLWGRLQEQFAFSMLCGYPVRALGQNEAHLEELERLHGQIHLTGQPQSRDQQRLQLLVRAGEIFHRSLDVNETLENVARLAVESFADICLFDLLDEQSDRLFVTAAAHRDPSMQDALGGISQVFYLEEFGMHPVVRVTRTGEPFFLPHIDEKTLVAHAASRQHEQYMRAFGYRSKIVVPVIAQNQIFGALTFVRTREEDAFDQGDLLFAIEIGRRAGVAVANAKQFHREQYVAETLQRAFLPRHFPKIDGIGISAHYRPGSNEADIGGDWYDAFENERGELVITIGDVTGKGIEAARLMVLLRQSIRVAALEHHEPQQIAKLCNRMLLREHGDRLASAFIGVLDPKTHILRYVSAGHAPPLLRAHDHVIRLKSPSPPLGAFSDAVFERYEIPCPSESMLLLYTDGVIEVTRDLLHGEHMLERVLSSDAVLHASNPAEFIERAIGQEAPRDDIAVLALTFGAKHLRWQFEAADARSAYAMRDEFFSTLQQLSVTSEDTLSACGLIFAELVGNAVRHAPGALSVSLEMRGDDIVLHMIDKGPGFDYSPALPENLWSESGRGLFLIETLARRVAVERIPGIGSHIAVTLPVTCDTITNAA